MKIKDIVFLLHKIFRCYVLFGWTIDKKVLIMQMIVMLSWYINNNRCLVSQIEKYFFNETFQENNTSYVNKDNRIILYLLFGVGCIYNFL